MSKINQKIKNKNNKGSLGRGLESLLGAGASSFVNSEATPGAIADSVKTPKSQNLKPLSVAVEWIKPNKNQPRSLFDNEALEGLAKSIKAQGILQPIVVRSCGERSFEIIAGERRWRAAQKIGLTRVPVIVKEVDDHVSAQLALIENIQREDLNPMEEAEALQNLLSMGSLTQQSLADKLGKNRSSLANLLRLLNLDSEVRNLLRQDKLSLGQAKLLLSLEDVNLQKHFAYLAVKKSLSVQLLSRLIKKEKLQKKAESLQAPLRTEKQMQLEKVQEQIQKKLGTKVKLEYAGGQGHLGIHFSTDAQLNQIVQSLMGLK